MTTFDAVEFAKMLKKELFDKQYVEYCSNAGDAGEACDCCPVLDKDGNPVVDEEE